MLTYTGQFFDWRSEAACTDADAELFFSEEPEEQERAKAICAGCPRRAECLATAMLREDDWGIWGGMTPEERVQHGRTWRRRMGGGDNVRALRERVGIRKEPRIAINIVEKRNCARLRAARQCRAMLDNIDVPRKQQYIEIMDMIIENPTLHSALLARRVGLSKTWFNTRKREAFLICGVSDSISEGVSA